jgi:Chemotaxis phosphatase CheX
MKIDESKATWAADEQGPPSRSDPEFTLPLAARGQKGGGVGSYRVHADDAIALRKVCIECAQEVFDIYRFAIEPSEDDALTNPISRAPLAAIIGFGGDVFRGTLTIVAPFRLFQSWYPSHLPDTAEAGVDVLDWAGEFVNQLLGRVKRRLFGRGVVLVASLPRVMLGNEFRVPSSNRSHVCELRFCSAGEPVGLWLDAIANQETPVLAGTGESPPDDQGDMLLF